MELRHPAYTRIIAIFGFVLCLGLAIVAAYFAWHLHQVSQDVSFSSLLAAWAVFCLWFAASHSYRMRIFCYVYTLTPDRMTCYSPFSRRTVTIRTGEPVYVEEISVNGGHRRDYVFERGWRLVAHGGTEIRFSEALPDSSRVWQQFHPLLRSAES